ncbi:MAG: PIG-L family deacetylase [Acidobacteriota bacterium]
MSDVVAFGAHPDDLEFGMGGALVRMAREGVSITEVVLTRGEGGTYGDPETREKEQRRAAEIIGCDVKFLDFRDGRVEFTRNGVIEIVRVIRELRPRICFAPYDRSPYTHRDRAAHPDHQITGKLVRHACRLAKFSKFKTAAPPHLVEHLFFYMVPKGVLPSFVMDFSDYYDDWVRAVSAHESQIQNLRDGQLRAYLEAYKVLYGSFIDRKYAEGFYSPEPLEMSPAAMLATRSA